MSAHRIQQRAWTPDMDPSYHRWEPPVFPGLPVRLAEASSVDGSGRRMESAFARSSFPTSFAGWDQARAKEQAQQDGLAATAQFGAQHSLPSVVEAAQPAHTLGNEPATGIFPMYSLPAFSSLQSQGSGFRAQNQDGASACSAFPGGGHTNSAGLHDSRSRSAGWPTQTAFGASFDGILQPTEPADLRFGMRGMEAEAGVRGNGKEGDRQGGAILVQCGSFSAPVQRQAMPQQSHAWENAQYVSQLRPPKLQRRTSQPLEPQNVLQAQEFYTAQSDVLEELMRSRAHPGVAAHAHGAEIDADHLDVMAPLHLPRSNSASELVALVGASGELEPYMPAWQSESMPAALSNHIVNRLIMGAHNPTVPTHRRGGRSGVKRSSDWGSATAMPSIPDGEQLEESAAEDCRKSHASGELSDPPQSPNPDALEELARTADVEVAHRAFLVPPHKKRGKGGRQPAADPRLDPNIDSRRAKRILANRLSAARSKMKQKNQMDSLGTIVKTLEDHKEQLQGDLRDLLRSCEKASQENRVLAQQIKVLEEYGRRQLLVHARLHAEQSALVNLEPRGSMTRPLESPAGQPAAASRPRTTAAKQQTDGPCAPGSAGEPGREAGIAASESDVLLVGLDTGAISAGDALLEFAQGNFMGQ